MKNIATLINNRMIGLVNDIAERVGESSVTKCQWVGAYEIEIPIELLNVDEE